ncbi:enoyl-CoA hydratase/isomerase family protein [Halorussus halophilus]|uniref:enoyl-CoA hydratase/isomerase family protein n=1 Tax=Halorussus halophilus TaxID=2650975 RepID=UPI0013013AC1|nr:enoyl-CoA hydratase-related protein [Halorussus halophilus]
MDFDNVSVERTDGVARISIERPATHNSLDRQTAADLQAAVERVVDDRAVRCVVLTGTESVFCTGADLSVLDGDSNGDSDDPRRLREIATRLHATVAHLATARKPVVAGVNGVAAGGGLGLALCADVVLASENARFEFAYPKLGLSGDGGSTYFLPRLVGLRKAQEIALLDEPIPADEAVEIGLATEVGPSGEFEDRLAELATRLADGPTRAYGATKRLLSKSYGRNLSAQLAAETDAITQLARTGDYERGLAAFFEKEEAEFEGQ